MSSTTATTSTSSETFSKMSSDAQKMCVKVMVCTMDLIVRQNVTARLQLLIQLPATLAHFKRANTKRVARRLMGNKKYAQLAEQLVEKICRLEKKERAQSVESDASNASSKGSLESVTSSGYESGVSKRPNAQEPPAKRAKIEKSKKSKEGKKLLFC